MISIMTMKMDTTQAMKRNMIRFFCFTIQFYNLGFYFAMQLASLFLYRTFDLAFKLDIPCVEFGFFCCGQFLGPSFPVV